MVFRKSTKLELDVIMQILHDARKRMGKLGIDQWQYGYPSRELVADDIKSGNSYVAIEDNVVAAVFTVIESGEPTYDNIYEGEWISKGKYIAVHRIAVSNGSLRKGVAGKCMSYAEGVAKELGYSSVRIDTHEGNLPMRGMLEKCGYKYCGIIYLGDGHERVAYEKQV